MYGVVKEAGKYVFIHSCGDVDELFDDLICMLIRFQSCGPSFVSRTVWIRRTCRLWL